MFFQRIFSRGYDEGYLEPSMGAICQYRGVNNSKISFGQFGARRLFFRVRGRICFRNFITHGDKAKISSSASPPLRDRPSNAAKARSSLLSDETRY